jgi:hypothetical protein
LAEKPPNLEEVMDTQMGVAFRTPNTTNWRRLPDAILQLKCRVQNKERMLLIYRGNSSE